MLSSSTKEKLFLESLNHAPLRKLDGISLGRQIPEYYGFFAYSFTWCSNPVPSQGYSLFLGDKEKAHLAAISRMCSLFMEHTTHDMPAARYMAMPEPVFFKAKILLYFWNAIQRKNWYLRIPFLRSVSVIVLNAAILTSTEGEIRHLIKGRSQDPIHHTEAGTK